MNETLPASFCWTRFGTEAGETVDRILERKEFERRQNGGVFLWGIGNAIGPSMRELLRLQVVPEVIFSPIASRPKPVDVAPTRTVAWTSASDLEGRSVALPRWSKVISRASIGLHTSRHYALVCHSDVALRFHSSPLCLRMTQLHNLITNNRVGASQVTAVVRYAENRAVGGLSYAIALRARLVAPFFVALSHPVLAAQKPTLCAG